MNTVDMISVDDATGDAILHLVVEGPWNDVPERIEWLRTRLNVYSAFVTTGQLAAAEKYRGRRAKILVHCEVQPPSQCLLALTSMRQYLIALSIAFGVTVGRDLKTEVELPEPS